jgi:4-alpha-glucanotransferase
MKLAFERFAATRTAPARRQMEAFLDRTRVWLADFALFSALKSAHAGAPWTEWPQDLKNRRPGAIRRARRALNDEIAFVEFQQFVFDTQWRRLRDTCHELGIRLLGDVPIYVAHDGADVWAHRELFFVDSGGRRNVVAGVPPDFFSSEGQLWGNPLYRWAVLKQTGYAWWIDRMGAALSRFDALRLDHFIGFHRYWEVPGGARSARRGRFIDVPGEHFFEALKAHIGSLPFIAEDLGTVTPEVHALRRRFALPGMVVLQFAFGEGGGGSEYLPHRHEPNSVVYTGTHDNDTSVGWLRARVGPRASPRARAEARRALQYLQCDRASFCSELVRAGLMSVANTAIFPMQDLLGLGSRSRMNVPGTTVGNWQWRLSSAELDPKTAERLAGLCQIYQR